VGVTEKEICFHFTSLPRERFHDFCARSELGEVGLFSAKSPARGIFTGYTDRETAGQKFSGNIGPLPVSK
jgi:hypothetical protein